MALGPTDRAGPRCHDDRTARDRPGELAWSVRSIWPRCWHCSSRSSSNSRRRSRRRSAPMRFPASRRKAGPRCCSSWRRASRSPAPRWRSPFRASRWLRHRRAGAPRFLGLPGWAVALALAGTSLLGAAALVLALAPMLPDDGADDRRRSSPAPASPAASPWPRQACSAPNSCAAASPRRCSAARRASRARPDRGDVPAGAPHAGMRSEGPLNPASDGRRGTRCRFADDKAPRRSH